MTISTTEPRKLYTGNGTTTSFAVPFNFDADTDLKVEIIVASTGDVTLQTLNTDYTISSTNVVMTTAPAATEKLLITLDLDFEQATNYTPNDPFPAETHEDALDEIVKQVKQLKHQIDYNIPKLPSNTLTSSTVTDTDIKAKYVFHINSSATGIALNPVEDIIDVNALTDTIIQAADEIMFADASDSYNVKKDTVQGIVDLAISSSASGTIVEVDGSQVNSGIPTLDFDGTDFSLTESPDDSFDITINAERVQDIAGAMFTGNTETGITATYQDGDGTIDLVVSDLTVAGDTGSTGMTPGDTLTIAGGTNITTAMSGDTLTINNDYTDESIQDLVGAMFTGNTETLVTVTYQDADGTIDVVVDEASINHDNLTGFVANEHIDWTSAASNFNTSGSITGTGVVDFGGATSFELPSATSVTTNAAGEIAMDTDGNASTVTTGVIQGYDGTNTLYWFGATNYPTSDNDVMVYDSATNAVKWEAQSGASGLSNVVDDTTPQLGGQLDVNGQAIGDGTNELLTFTEDASAVNHVNIENEATGSGPIISAAGDDTNIDLILDGKGSGVVKTTSSNLDITGNIVVSGTVDGRDVATDGTKLDGIEANADVTDATNVDAAGATMNTDTDVSGNSWVIDEDNMVSNLATKVPTQQSVKAYVDASAGGGGDWTLISTATASASSTVDFDNVFDTTYDVYVLVGNNIVPGTDATQLAGRVGTGATPTYQSGAGAYKYKVFSTTLATSSYANESSASATEMIFHDATAAYKAGTGTGETFNFVFYIWHPADATAYTNVTGMTCGYSDGAHPNQNLCSSTYVASTAVTSIQFFMSSGTVASGEFRLYGLSKS